MPNVSSRLEDCYHRVYSTYGSAFNVYFVDFFKRMISNMNSKSDWTLIRCLPDSPKPVSPKPDSPKLGFRVRVRDYGLGKGLGLAFWRIGFRRNGTEPFDPQTVDVDQAGCGKAGSV